MKEVFGDSWWILPSESGKFALIKTQINVGDKSLDDLTDEQRRNADIEIFDTRDKAEEERKKQLFAALFGG